MRSHGSSAHVGGVAVAAVLLGCAAPTVDVAAEESSIREVLTQTMDALQNQDFEALRANCSEDWVHFNHMGGKWTLAETQQFFEEHMTDHMINVSNISVQVSQDGTLGWAKFDEETEYQFDGNPVQENAIFTAIFGKLDGEWKMTHLHRTVVAEAM